MNGTITSHERTATKHVGTIAGEEGIEYRFDEPLEHLDDSPRALEPGAAVTFKASGHHQHEGLAYDVRLDVTR